MESNEKVIEAVKTILNELNGGNRKRIAEDILATVRRDHRTLQQAFWSSMLLAQIGYAESASDLRNEQAVEVAKAVKELAEKRNWDYGLAFI